MLELEYLIDNNGQRKAVVISMELWEKMFLSNDVSPEDVSEAIEDYCMNKAMDEAPKSPLLNREEALAYLET